MPGIPNISDALDKIVLIDDCLVFVSITKKFEIKFTIWKKKNDWGILNNNFWIEENELSTYFFVNTFLNTIRIKWYGFTR